MEGTRQNILIISEDKYIANTVYSEIRKSTYRDLNLIKIDHKNKYLIAIEENDISLVVVCVKNNDVCDKILKTVLETFDSLPILTIAPSGNSVINHTVLSYMLKSPLVFACSKDDRILESVLEGINLKNILYLSPSVPNYFQKVLRFFIIFSSRLRYLKRIILFVGLQIIQVISATIKSGKKSDTLLTREMILRSINYAGEKFLNNADWKANLPEVLQAVGESSQVDRLYIFQNKKDNEGNYTARAIECWCSKDLACIDLRYFQNDITYEELGYDQWFEQLAESEFVQCHVGDITSNQKIILKNRKVKSLLIVPIHTNGDWWGFIGFEQCKTIRKWLDMEIDALRTASSIIASAISRQLADDRIKHMATHDYLTNLPNRLLFEDRMRSAISRAQRSKHWIGLFVLDIDKFKAVNDSYGHPYGDEVLKDVGVRLKNVIRASDTVARIGGDEFAVIGEEIHDAEDISRIAKKILEAFYEPIKIADIETVVSFSIGVSIYPADSTQIEELMRFADIALYKAKEVGGDYKIYSKISNNQLGLDNIAE